jgi:hypothetical protein
VNPVDVIANAIRAADGQHTMGAGQLAEVAAKALDDEAILANAVAALIADGWTETHGGEELPRHDLVNIARTVLRSVGGG